MQEILFATIPHKDHIYPTVGDYFKQRDGRMVFLVSEMKDWRYEFLVLVHELVEWAWAKNNNVSLRSIDRFDILYEKERSKGLHKPYEEPGDDPRAPYRKGHQLATKVEKLVSVILKVRWKDYEKAVNSL